MNVDFRRFFLTSYFFFLALTSFQKKTSLKGQMEYLCLVVYIDETVELRCQIKQDIIGISAEVLEMSHHR